MALVLRDRVKEQSTTTGTGSFTLTGAYDGFQTFAAAIASGSTVYYCIHNLGTGATTEWEVGVGTFTSPSTLSRDTILESSASGAKVTFSAGTKEVFVTYPAEKGVILDGSGNTTPLGTVASGTWNGTAIGAAYGGTGATTLTANNVILGNGTSAVQFVAPGATGNLLTSNGTTWGSSAPPASIPSGTIMLFRQTAAPTGWTKDTTNYNDSALRVVTGTVSSGGSVGFTTAFASQAVSGSVSISGGSVSATTLTTTQMPSHSHTAWCSGTVANGTTFGRASAQGVQNSTDAAGGGGSHTHGFTQPTGSFTGTAINLAVKYCDVIFATKD